jgi:DNA invertase Pin-like site-specific DNA recombinase
MLIGYARISTHEQDLQLQLDALSAVGCETIYQDTASGSIGDRPGLAEALAYVRAGDALVVWRLDRLGRSLRHLIEVGADLESRDVGLRSLQESIDTTT